MKLVTLRDGSNLTRPKFILCITKQGIRNNLLLFSVAIRINP